MRLSLFAYAFFALSSSSSSSAKALRTSFIGSASSIKELETIVNLGKPEFTLDSPLLKPLLVPRVSGTDGNTKVQEFLIKTLTDLNYHIEQDKFTSHTPLGTKEFNNIIATKDPKARNKLVLSAHFDSKYYKDFDFIGATDSSAPCAIILDVATKLNSLFEKRLQAKKDEQLFGDQGMPTLQLIFFDGEEAFESWTSTDSLYGSRHLAEKWSTSYFMQTTDDDDGTTTTQKAGTYLENIDALVLLDLLGAKDPHLINTNENTQWFWDRIVSAETRLWEEGYLSDGHSEQMKANLYDYGYFVDGWTPASAYRHVDDDHRPFRDKGVRCVHVIPSPFPSVWHKEADNASALDMDVINDFALIFRVVVAEYFGLFIQ